MPSRPLLLAALLAACDSTPAPAPSTAPAPAPSDMSQKPATPPPAAADLYTSSDGAVAGPRPPGDGWECVEQRSPAPGQEVTLIKCRRTDRERFFFLMAKDYAVPADQVRAADTLATQVFPETYKQLFTRHAITQTREASLAGRTGTEVTLDAEHASMGPIKKRELVLTAGDHVFVVSAEGKPEVFAAESAAIEAWFTGVRFRRLAE